MKIATKPDKIIPIECGILYRQAIPGADLAVIEQCGHAPHLEKPDEFVRLAMDFLP
jgi:2-hydroxy-6-oxonona-2,4-dienedioate hydrolase